MPNHYLIIDDDDDDQSLLKEAFEEIDPVIICDSALNGVEGLLMLRSGMITRPKIIFADLNMPRMGGKQFLTVLKKDVGLKDIPVVIYYTSSDEAEIKLLINLGAYTFLIKSSNYSDMVIKLREVIDAAKLAAVRLP